MNRSVTLSAKGVLVALVAALALLVAYLLGNSGSSAQAAAPDRRPAVARPSADAGDDAAPAATVGVPDELAFSAVGGRWCDRT